MPIIIAGHKHDTQTNIVVPKQLIDGALKEWNYDHIICSSKNEQNIFAIFENILNKWGLNSGLASAIVQRNSELDAAKAARAAREARAARKASSTEAGKSGKA